MKRWGILLTVFWSVALLYANDALDQQLWRDYLSTSHKSKKMAEDRVWLFNDSIYQQNEEGQWEQISFKNNLPEKRSEWLEDLADRKVCPKEHPGVFFDTKFEKPGVWYCRGFLPDGRKCFFHVDLQFKNR